MLVLVLAVSVIALSRPALAACHTAAFTDDSVFVNEKDGQVTLTVELVGGQPTCSGTVQYQTVDGTAKAGSDYTARQGTLSFSPGDDRRESFSVPIINDASDEPAETFTVRLFGGTGSISADDTATVTITDDDPAPSSPPPPGPSTPPPTQTTKSPSPSPTSTPASPSPSLTPTSSAPPPPQAAPAADTSSNAWVIAGIVLAVAVLIGGGVWLFRKRAG